MVIQLAGLLHAVCPGVYAALGNYGRPLMVTGVVCAEDAEQEVGSQRIYARRTMRLLPQVKVESWPWQ